MERINLMESPVPEFSGGIATVFLLAENRLLREALLRTLSKKDDIHIVGAGSIGPGMLEKIVSTGAKVVVLDSLSPLLPEQSLVYMLHRLNPAIAIVMVGMELKETVFLRVIQAGALGYVLKDASAAEVARTIRAVAAGEAVCPAALSATLFQWVARNRVTVPNSQLKGSLGLSGREQQLVGLIQQGLTNKEIARRLNLSEQTVKNHVHRMLRKVGASDRLSIAEICRNAETTLS